MVSQQELRQRLQAQLAEALGPENQYYAGERLGRQPEPKEAVDHYLHHGGPENFARREQERKIEKPNEV